MGLFKEKKVKLGTTVRPSTMAALRNHAWELGLDGPGPAIDDLAGLVSGLGQHAAARFDKLISGHIEERRSTLALETRIDAIEEGFQELDWLQRLQGTFRAYGSQWSGVEQEESYRSIELADGDYAVVPADWDVIETSDPEASHYVYHAFMRNSEKLGIPEAAIVTSHRLKEDRLKRLFLEHMAEKNPKAVKKAKENMVPEVLGKDGVLLHYDRIEASNNVYSIELADYRNVRAWGRSHSGGRCTSVIRGIAAAGAREPADKKPTNILDREGYLVFFDREGSFRSGPAVPGRPNECVIPLELARFNGPLAKRRLSCGHLAGAWDLFCPECGRKVLSAEELELAEAGINAGQKDTFPIDNMEEFLDVHRELALDGSSETVTVKDGYGNECEHAVIHGLSDGGSIHRFDSPGSGVPYSAVYDAAGNEALSSVRCHEKHLIDFWEFEMTSEERLRNCPDKDEEPVKGNIGRKKGK